MVEHPEPNRQEQTSRSGSRRGWAHRRVLVAAALTVLVGAAAPALAHVVQVEPVVMEIKGRESYLTAEFKGNIQDILQAVQITDQERQGTGFAAAAVDRLTGYMNEKLKLRQGEHLLPGEITLLRGGAETDVTRSRFHMVMRFNRPGDDAGDRKFRIENSLFDYLQNPVLVVSVGGFQQQLRPGEATEIDPSAVAANLLRNIWDFGVMGVEHIFTGKDHILFIIALLLVAPTLREVIKVLSGFAIAHSITLVLVTLQVITPPEKIVAVIIILSIIYVAIENMFIKEQKHRFWVSAAFGLIHGSAFGAGLREIGLPEQGLVWCLLSFNLGVELAQVILCLLAFPILSRLRRDFERRSGQGSGLEWKTVIRAASAVVVLTALLWLGETLTG